MAGLPNRGKSDEASWLLAYVLGQRPSSTVAARLDRALTGLPALPPAIAGSGRVGHLALRVIEPWLRVRSPLWRIRLDLATRVAEACPEGASRFYALPDRHSRASALAALLWVPLEVPATVLGLAIKAFAKWRRAKP